jgi:hypothetical protein
MIARYSRENAVVFLSGQSSIVARERYADLLREAAHERQLNTLRPAAARWPVIVAYGRALRNRGMERLLSIACPGNRALRPCPE